MRLGLRAGELAEDGECGLLGSRREAGGLNDGVDVRKRAVRVVVAVCMVVLVLMIVPVAVLVFMPMVVAMPVPFFPVLAKEPRHVVVVVLVLAVELHVEVAGVKAALCHAAHADLETVDRQGVQRG